MNIYRLNKHALIFTPEILDTIFTQSRIVKANASRWILARLTEAEYYELLGAVEAFLRYGDTCPFYWVGDHSAAVAMRRSLQAGSVGTRRRCW